MKVICRYYIDGIPHKLVVNEDQSRASIRCKTKKELLADALESDLKILNSANEKKKYEEAIKYLRTYYLEKG